MSKIIVRRQEYANNGTHANEIEAVVRDNLIVNTLSSATDVVPSVGLLNSVKSGLEGDVDAVESKVGIAKVIHFAVHTPRSIPANSHISTTFTLPKTVQLYKHCFMICPVTFVNTAFISVSGHWGKSGEDASSLTESDSITVYITNHHTASQTAGVYLFVIERTS